MDQQQQDQQQQQQTATATTSSLADTGPLPTERKGCSLLPHGGYPLIPATLSTMAWVLSLAQDGCAHAKLTGPTVDELTASSSVIIKGGIPYLEAGFNAYRAPQYWPDSGEWKVDYTSACTAYDPDVVTKDIIWFLGKAFEFCAILFGGAGALFLFFSSCFVFSPATWRWAGYEVAAAAFFQSLAFVWFATSMCRMEGNTCALFFGSKSDIAAAAMWATSALAIFILYPSPQPKEGQGSAAASATQNFEEGWQDGLELGSQTTSSETDTFENDELPLEGDAKVKMKSSKGNSVHTDPEVEVPAHGEDQEII